MNYSEALEQQVGALRTCSRPEVQAHWLNNWHDAEYFNGAWQALLWSLACAEPVYVDRPICASLGAVALQEMPPWKLAAGALLAPHGFCWFASNPGYHDPTDPAAELLALSWTQCWVNHIEREGRIWSAITHQGRADDAEQAAPALLLFPWYGTKGRSPRSAIAPWSPMIAPFGADMTRIHRVASSGAPISDGASADGRFTVALFGALTLFLQQRILMAPQERAERHARKRLEQQGWTHEPLIRVVQLRRRESAPHERDGDPQAVDWSCQWVVRGHWRQQACGVGQKDRRPIWITPHVKGPEEKPLKAPRATVFAVVR